MKRIGTLALIYFSLNATASAETFPLVGKSTGQERARMVGKDAYFNLLHSLSGTVHDSTLPTLASQQATASGWLLRDVAVGIGFALEVGLGPIWSTTIAPRVRFVFSNSTSPTLP
ncbi:MAG TPA: hypothetical protein VIH99_03255 [Bdellovibrionota bacterium]|jgi:hypothetical protein